MAFNPKTQLYEVRFKEDWWNRGWHSQATGALNKGTAADISREALLRFLGTANALTINVLAKGRVMENARISDLSLEVARDVPSGAEDGLQPAPVEICECLASEAGGRKLSTSCEVSNSLLSHM